MSESDSRSFEDVVSESVTYGVSVTAGKLSGTHEWTNKSEAYGLEIYIDEDGIEFSGVVA
jgi:hypothetical protein